MPQVVQRDVLHAHPGARPLPRPLNRDLRRPQRQEPQQVADLRVHRYCAAVAVFGVVQHQGIALGLYAQQLAQAQAAVKGHADGDLRLPVGARSASLQHGLAADVDLPLVVDPRQLHARRGVVAHQPVCLPSPPAGGLEHGQAVAHGGGCHLSPLCHFPRHCGQRRQGLAGVGPGDGAQVLGGGLVALQARLVAQVQDDGLVDQGVALLEASRSGVEPPAFFPVVGVSMGLTPTPRKKAAKSVPATFNDAVELVAPALVAGVPADRHDAR